MLGENVNYVIKFICSFLIYLLLYFSYWKFSIDGVFKNYHIDDVSVWQNITAGLIVLFLVISTNVNILCDSCKNGLKNVKWTEHIGKVIIREVIKDDDIVEQIFTIKTNSAIIDNSQNYTIKQNNDKFIIEVPNIKMSLSSPTDYTKYYILNCVFNYNNHINTFHIRFESIGCSFCNETKQYIIDDDETEMAHQDGFYISQKNDKIIWYSYPYSDKNNQYITNKDNTYCVYNITNDNWTLYIELGINTSHFTPSEI